MQDASKDRDPPMKRFSSWLQEKAPPVHKFLSSHDKPYPIMREISVIGVVILILAGAIWGGTGQRIGDAPVVVVESGSMMHCDNGIGQPARLCDAERYGRVGTIDPGDLVFVKKVDSRSDVKTLAQAGKERYGKSGDVIVFQPDGRLDKTPIIHRALFWLEIHGNRTFSVPDLDLYNITDLNHPKIMQLVGRAWSYHQQHFMFTAGPEDSGFITRGDNNLKADQPSDVANMPVQLDWILGKARGEVPWVGLIKLKFSDMTGPTNNYANAPGDVKTMLWVSLIVLVGTPFLIEALLRRRRLRSEEKAQEELLGTQGDQSGLIEDEGPPGGGEEE